MIGPNNGIYKTDQFGRITIKGLTPGMTVTAKETRTLDGYVLDSKPQSITIKEGETPYSETGRQLYFKRTKKKRIDARLDEMYSESTAKVVSNGNWGTLNNFEFIMNRAYALNRDKLKCRVCGGWLISCVPYAHRIIPNLPLNKVNRVNNLVSLHKRCFDAVNNPQTDISEFYVKAQKKIQGFREKLVSSHTRNKLHAKSRLCTTMDENAEQVR